jgi:hypothetical protein
MADPDAALQASTPGAGAAAPPAAPDGGEVIAAPPESSTYNPRPMSPLPARIFIRPAEPDGDGTPRITAAVEVQVRWCPAQSRCFCSGGRRRPCPARRSRLRVALARGARALAPSRPPPPSAPKDIGGASSLSSVATLCNSAIGAGVLSLPYAFKCAGLAGGLLLCALVAAAESFSLYILSKARAPGTAGPRPGGPRRAPRRRAGLCGASAQLGAKGRAPRHGGTRAAAADTLASSPSLAARPGRARAPSLPSATTPTATAAWCGARWAASCRRCCRSSRCSTSSAAAWPTWCGRGGWDGVGWGGVGWGGVAWGWGKDGAGWPRTRGRHRHALTNVSTR